MKQNSKTAGMTLIEVIVSVALLGLVVTGAYSLINFARLYFEKSKTEYQFQFSTRYTLQKTSDIIRYSTAVFTIPESSFRDTNLDSGWDYIGIVDTADGEQIVKYTYDLATDRHLESILVPAREDVRYEFAFTKVNPSDEDSLLKFSIRSFPAGSVDEHGDPVPAVTVTSEVNAQNSLQIIDLSTPPYDPAVAIAFRSEERIQSVVGHVAMVLDTSGSMAWGMNGSSYSTPSRISVLKDQAATLINNFATEDNIDIKLVPFNTSANDSDLTVYAFKNAKTYTSSLLTAVNNLTADGGTNTGDGLRRAYWALYNHNREVGAGVRASNYLIVLVDGVTTFASVHSHTDRSFVTEDGYVDEGFLDTSPTDRTNGQIAGNGGSLDTTYGRPYVNLIGASQISGFARVYVIGFSAVASDLNSVNDIATACGALPENVYTASSPDALAQVFDAVRQDIVNDLWYLQGPQL
jgi:prepilin-type N-terminal cleavage/methylation domain-containing protein